MTKTVLILGASGRFGRNADFAFSKAGWDVRRFKRGTDDLEKKAAGGDVILNGWNPPDYTSWAAEIPGLTRQVIKAARTSGATVIIPGNVYNFGQNPPAVLSENTTHTARNHLGKVRAAMEAAYRKSGVKTIVLRGGDYIDTKPSGNWFDLILTKDLAKGVLKYPGAANVPHAWAYLPDFARAAVALAEKRAELSTFEDVPFPGFTLSGQELRSALEHATGKPVRLSKMSYLPMWIAGAFWPLGRRLLEMRYLWSKPHRLDDVKFHQLLPDFKPTPLANALEQVLGQTDKI